MIREVRNSQKFSKRNQFAKRETISKIQKYEKYKILSSYNCNKNNHKASEFIQEQLYQFFPMQGI